MKKVLIYILLIFYVIVQLKPLTVIVQDVLAHTFFKMQHMATIHKENGQYHLHLQLKDISEKENSSSSEKTPSSQKFNENISAHVIQEFNFLLKNNDLKSQFVTFSKKDTVSIFLPINSPPPKA